jgi:hypothetical protein
VPHRPQRPAGRIPRGFAAIRRRLVDTGASDGTVNDLGAIRSMFFRDPDGLEGEVLIRKP